MISIHLVTGRNCAKLLNEAIKVQLLIENDSAVSPSSNHSHVVDWDSKLTFFILIQKVSHLKSFRKAFNHLSLGVLFCGKNDSADGITSPTREAEWIWQSGEGDVTREAETSVLPPADGGSSPRPWAAGREAATRSQKQQRTGFSSPEGVCPARTRRQPAETHFGLPTSRTGTRINYCHGKPPSLW